MSFVSQHVVTSINGGDMAGRPVGAKTIRYRGALVRGYDGVYSASVRVPAELLVCKRQRSYAALRIASRGFQFQSRS
jgi:hypothetical protein